MPNISIDQFANEIANAVREYTEDVSAAIEAKVDEVANQVLAEVKSLAPKNTGEYAKTFVKTDQGSAGKAKRVIWNRKHYRRVHLLEFGHAFIRGGRAAARPHLRPAYEKYGATLPDDIKRIIKNGGGS